MSYYIATTLNLPFEKAIERTEAALKEQGFGIISRIDLQAAFKEKIGVDFRPYTILGACNPKLAHEALQLEDKVGTMLPCNVVVQAKGERRNRSRGDRPRRVDAGDRQCGAEDGGGGGSGGAAQSDCAARGERRRRLSRHETERRMTEDAMIGPGAIARAFGAAMV